MKKQKKILTILTISVISLAILNLNSVYAQTPTPTRKNPFSILIDMVVQKFNLDKSQVQGVFDQFQNQRKTQVQENAQQREEDRLNKLVAANKITPEQKQAILAELKFLRDKYDKKDLKNMTPDERQKQFQAEQDELKKWAESQGIDPTYLTPGFGMGKGRPMRGFNKWPKTTLTPTP